MSGSPCIIEKSLLRVLLKVKSLELKLLTFCATIFLPRKKSVKSFTLKLKVNFD